MPLLLRADELEPGMRLFDAVIWQGRTLLTGGKTINHADITALRRKFPELVLRVGDPILDEVVEFEDDSRERQVAATAQKKVASAMSKVTERFSARAAVGTVNVKAMHDSVTDVMQFLSANPVSAAVLTRGMDANSYLSEHTGNVFYLSMLLGGAVRDYVMVERQRRTAARGLSAEVAMDLLPLALGSMVADLGMMPLQHLYTSDQPLTDQYRQAIREHPAAGAEMLPGEFSATARAVVRTHHENYDGTGYPKGLAGDEIHVFSRIVRIADAFDAATATHVYSQAKTSARALWEMTVGPYARFYDPVLMKVFALLIQPFPIGARLQLRDGRYAVVVRYNREAPFEPTVVIAFDSNGKRLEAADMEGPLCLTERTDLRIQSFGEEQLSFLHGATAADEVCTVRKDFNSIFEASFP